jgi:hypothetical protein
MVLHGFPSIIGGFLPPCPIMPMPYTCLGVTACQVGRHEMAIELIGQAIQQNENNSPILFIAAAAK